MTLRPPPTAAPVRAPLRAPPRPELHAPGPPAAAPLLASALAACRVAFLIAAAFSLVISVLSLTMPIYLMQTFDRVMTSRSMDTLWFLTLAAVFLLLLQSVLEGFRTGIMTRVGSWLERRLWRAALEKEVDLRLSPTPPPPQILSDLGMVRGFLVGPGVNALFDAPWVPLYLAALFLLAPVLGFVSLASVILLLIFAVATEFAMRDPLRDATRRQAEINVGTTALLRAAETVEAMGMRRAAIDRLGRQHADAIDESDSANDRAAALLSLTRFMRLLVQVVSTFAGTVLVLDQHITAGAMIAASYITGKALSPVEQMIGGWRQAVQARQAYQRLRASLVGVASEPELRTRLPRPKGVITAERLIYVPGPGARPVLRDVSFTVGAGETLAVIGPSGAGKTTLMRMLVGVLLPSAGIVRLDGLDLRAWEPEQRGGHIGYLPQTAELLPGTVRDNIARLGTGSDAAVLDAARAAGAHEMLLRLPKGYDTEVGVAGMLSGGQRQQVALARALYGAPPVLVLDEPTGNLDGESAVQLLRLVQELRSRGTTIVIATHVMSLAQQADRIMLMRDGTIERFGPKTEVLEAMKRQQQTQAEPAPAVARGASR